MATGPGWHCRRCCSRLPPAILTGSPDAASGAARSRARRLAPTRGPQGHLCLHLCTAGSPAPLSASSCPSFLRGSVRSWPSGFPPARLQPLAHSSLAGARAAFQPGSPAVSRSLGRLLPAAGEPRRLGPAMPGKSSSLAGGAQGDMGAHTATHGGHTAATASPCPHCRRAAPCAGLPRTRAQRNVCALT